MYTVSKGPSKIVAKTRRITQNLDRLETLRDLSRKPTESTLEENIQSTPKPVFHTNGKRNGSQRHQQEVISPQHEEIIRYINESWNHIANSPPHSPVQSSSPEPPTTLYYVESPNAVLHDFKPFDLESWWGRRLFHNITKTL